MRTIPAATVSAVALLVLAHAAAVAQSSPSDTGRVTGRVLSAYLSRAGGIAVTLTRLDRRASGPRTVMTDDTGRFVFDRVDAGRYEVSANAPRFTSRRLLEHAPRFAPGVTFTVDRATRVT